MKIETLIQPRKDGTVNATVPSGLTYTFRPDEFGSLVAEVEGDGDIVFLLSAEDRFVPAGDEDFAAADALLSVPAAFDAGDEDDEGDEAGEKSSLDAPPVEVPHAPKTRGRPRKAA